MKQLNFIIYCMIILNIASSSVQSQTPDLDKKTAQIKALHKPKDLVYELPLAILSDSTSITEVIPLLKDKYIIYALIDNEAMKKATFTLRFEAMKGTMQADEDKNRETIGKGFKAYKEFYCKPRIIENQFVQVGFKIDDVTNLSNNLLARSNAQYAANVSGLNQSFTRHKNCAPIKIKFEVAP